MNPHLPHFILLFLLAAGAYARHNVTVDDNDPGIVYAGAWGPSASTQLDFGGSHMLTQDPGATATFVFTGVSIYFSSPLWPYLVNTALSLDGRQPVLVDLVDHSQPTADGGMETVASAVVWSATGLDNAQHTLVVSVGAGQPFAVVDGLIYTVLDAGDPGFIPSSSSTTTSSSPSSSPSSSSSTSETSTSGRTVASSTPSPSSSTSASTHVLPIALGTILGILGLLLVAAAFWFCLHKRKRPVSEPWTEPPPFSPQTSQYSGRPDSWRSRFGYGEGGMPGGMAGVGSAAGRGTFGSFAASGSGSAGGARGPPAPGGGELGYGEYNPYVATQPPIPMPMPNSPPPSTTRGSNRVTQPAVSTLSTITESSTPRSPQHNTPASNPSEIGVGGAGGNSGVGGVGGGGTEEPVPPLPPQSLSGRKDHSPDSWYAQYQAQKKGVRPPVGFGGGGSAGGRS